MSSKMYKYCDSLKNNACQTCVVSATPKEKGWNFFFGERYVYVW